MGIPNVTIKHVASNTTLGEVQTLQMTKGKQKVTDNLRAGTAQVSGRDPDNLPTMLIGDTIEITVTNPNTSPTQTKTYEYRVADLQINYGYIPALDTWDLDLEDAFAYLGRAVVTRTWAPGADTSTVAGLICSDVGITLTVTGTNVSYLSGQTITNGSALDVFQVLANTEQALVQAGATNIKWYGRYWQNGLNRYYMSDDGTGTNPIQYDGLQFTSMADNYADNVIVFPRGSSAVASGSGIFSYNLDSYSFTTGQAQTLAQFVELVLQVQNSVPWTTSVLLNEVTSTSALLATDPGSLITLKFRGDTYNNIIEGFTLTADTTATRITYYMSNGEYYNFFILNNDVFGRLDLNRLAL